MQRRLMLALAGAGAVLVPEDVHAQSGNVQRPMPDVLLLVDTSGSMERMPDGSLPGEKTYHGLQSACVPGVESAPNRWGIMLQALTGNMQPYYSCVQQDRRSPEFQNEYKIAGVLPYDTRTEYFLPYHRPLTGMRSGSIDTVCAIGPHRLPGAAPGSGVGPGALGYSTAAGQGGDVTDFPEDALVTAKLAHMQQRYAANSPLDNPLNTNACIFDQAKDGQLDAARDYVRFALMTFDNDVDPGIGVNNGVWPPQGSIQTTDPFLGHWSYHRSSSNPDGAGPASGLPMNCIGPNLPFEVGARHWGAPPWEGRMVPFPPPDATLFDVQETNERIQRVLLATRPYGATPIDAMLDDARDYLWHNPIGPSSDPYVRDANCRGRYIILLTDGAPNLNMRPSCEGPGGVCPINGTAATIAKAMYDDTNRRVTTFVIGFSVNGESGVGGDGFPADIEAQGKNNCRAWYIEAGDNPQGMADQCNLHKPAPGTTAAACCVLNEIAFNGSGGNTGPFFAESQGDIVLAFGQILAAVTKAVSTRTVPTNTPTAYIPAGAAITETTSADFLGSFVPNAHKPWSGELARTRWVCQAQNPGEARKPTKQDLNTTLGDSMAVNLVTQGSENRLFLTFVPDSVGVAAGINPPTNTVVDAAGTVRPFYSALNPAPTDDGAPKQSGTEGFGTGSKLKEVPDIRLALDIDKTTCKRGRAVDPDVTGTGTLEIPALDRDNGEACTDVVLGFLTAQTGEIRRQGTGRAGNVVEYDFNVRCKNASSPTTGKCSVSATTCNVNSPSDCPTGETCVPDCAPLGAIFRANPVVVGPPDALLREQGYRDFQSRYARRKTVIYAATTDGILHAFKATEQEPGAHHELWSFIPPAVLPRLASNYPAGNQVLLDGTPVVKDTVWDRSVTDSNFDSWTKWHTTLVAGLGEGGGYYALNVTDSDCSQRDPNIHTGECVNATGSTGYDQPAKGDLDQAGRAQGVDPKRGPHFLWQLTDVPQSANLANETAKVTRRSRDGKNHVALFGRRTGTPAITTLQIKVDNVDHQIGVAILPGGIDGPPVKGQTCTRNLSDAENATDEAFPPRNEVRRWAPGTDPTCPEAVPGRSVTIVRLDTGQIIRHFGRSQDVPEAIRNAPGVFQPAPFMSPMTGTPVVYPQTTGAVGQKIFIGDADGNLWRIDVSSTDPAQWKVQLFADLLSGRSAEESQPIQVTPIISLDPSGNLIVNAATGDQDSIVYKPGEKNYVWSIEETRPRATAEPPRAKVKWFEVLDDGERVTGPMTVFDRTLYFATFAPKVPATNQCDDGGTGKIWGLNYFLADPANGGNPAAGGQPMWCASVDGTGACTSTSLVKNQAITSGHIIPGVTLRADQACAEITQNTDEWASTAFSSFTPSQFFLSFGIGQSSGNASAPPSSTLQRVQRPLPRISTRVDAWALVID